MLVVSWKDFMSRSARTWSLIAKQWQVYHYKGSNNQQHEAACFSTLQLSCLQWENSVWLKLQWPDCSLVACPHTIYSCRCFHKSVTFVFTLGLHSTETIQSIQTRGKTKSLSDWPLVLCYVKNSLIKGIQIFLLKWRMSPWILSLEPRRAKTEKCH